MNMKNQATSSSSSGDNASKRRGKRPPSAGSSGGNEAAAAAAITSTTRSIAAAVNSGIETVGSSSSSSPVNQRPPSAILIDEGIRFSSPPAERLFDEREEHMSLLELGEETMAQAMLIFLLADLRILSATGKIRTKFEHLALDSDRSPRLTSQDYAGFYDYDETDGVTASHIMAILLVEILREAEEVSENKRKHHRLHYNHKPALLSPWATTESAGTNAAKVFKRDIQAANGMPSLLHCYNEMLSEDVAPRIARVSRKDFPLDEDLGNPLMQTGGGNWIEQMDSEDVETRATGVSISTPGISECPEDEDVSIDGDLIINPNSISTPTSAPPSIPKPHSFGKVERSSSLGLQSHISVGGGGGGTSSSVGAAVTPGPPPTRHISRRASVNFRVSHFNPNVDIEEMQSDDDSIQLMPNARPKANSSDAQKKQTSEGVPEMTASQPHTPIQRMNASMPALNYKFKELRERVEKAIPEQLAKGMSELTKSLPKGPVARQEQEIQEIAQVQNQLLNWRDDGVSSEFMTPKSKVGGASSMKTNTNHSRGDASASKRILDGSDRSERKELSIRGKRLIPTSEEDEADQSSSLDDGFEVSASSSDDDEASYSPPEFHDSDTIRQLILQALDKRDFWRLGFIKTFFREGTVSHVLANSRAEMVWLSDWHTQYECTYAISIDREKKKVLLAFRGAYTESDWRHIVDWYDTATSNPVKEDYPGRAANIRLHSGFHKYLFRVRKDTQTTKYDEIAAKLAHYCKMTGPNTRITITGHSLGAALATIFSLYASTENRFTKQCGAIECVTFGSPCIGNWRFAGAVKHQENAGKLRIAKFHVKGDSVPHLPPALFRYSSRGAQYWHSGIDVSLPYIRKGKIFQTILGGQPKPKITYWDPDEESYIGSLMRQVREYYVWNLPLRFWRFALFHTLVEHKKRMALVSKSDPNSLLTKCSLKELYEMRDDLTRRPFWRKRAKNKKS